HLPDGRQGRLRHPLHLRHHPRKAGRGTRRLCRLTVPRNRPEAVCGCTLNCCIAPSRLLGWADERHLGPSWLKATISVLYHLYELNRAALAPLRAAADLGRIYFSTPLNPLSQTPFGRSTAAALEVFERVPRRYGRREFGIVETTVDGRTVPVAETVVWSRPFCRLLHFRKRTPGPKQPRLLIVAPLSGHFATLLRGTVRALLPDHDVHITDWTDARQVPLADG